MYRCYHAKVCSWLFTLQQFICLYNFIEYIAQLNKTVYFNLLAK